MERLSEGRKETLDMDRKDVTKEVSTESAIDRFSSAGFSVDCEQLSRFRSAITGVKEEYETIVNNSGTKQDTSPVKPSTSQYRERCDSPSLDPKWQNFLGDIFDRSHNEIAVNAADSKGGLNSPLKTDAGGTGTCKLSRAWKKRQRRKRRLTCRLERLMNAKDKCEKCGKASDSPVTGQTEDKMCETCSSESDVTLVGENSISGNLKGFERCDDSPTHIMTGPGCEGLQESKSPHDEATPSCSKVCTSQIKNQGRCSSTSKEAQSTGKQSEIGKNDSVESGEDVEIKVINCDSDFEVGSGDEGVLIIFDEQIDKEEILEKISGSMKNETNEILEKISGSMKNETDKSVGGRKVLENGDGTSGSDQICDVNTCEEDNRQKSEKNRTLNVIKSCTTTSTHDSGASVSSHRTSGSDLSSIPSTSGVWTQKVHTDSLPNSSLKRSLCYVLPRVSDLSADSSNKPRRDEPREQSCEQNKSTSGVWTQKFHENSLPSSSLKRSTCYVLPRVTDVSSELDNKRCEDGQKEQCSGQSPRRSKGLKRSWEETSPSPDQYVALDCEFVGVGERGRRNALARCSIVDYNGEVLLDIYSRPEEPITDYRTPWSGILPHHMRRAVPFARARDRIKQVIAGKIIIGHAIHNDFQVLNISPSPEQIRDTITSMKLRNMMSPRETKTSLKKMAKALLNRTIQVGRTGHCSIEDARASLDLFKLVEQDWDGVAPMIRKRQRTISETESYFDDAYWIFDGE